MSVQQYIEYVKAMKREGYGPRPVSTYDAGIVCCRCGRECEVEAWQKDAGPANYRPFAICTACDHVEEF